MNAFRGIVFLSVVLLFDSVAVHAQQAQSPTLIDIRVDAAAKLKVMQTILDQLPSALLDKEEDAKEAVKTATARAETLLQIVDRLEVAEIEVQAVLARIRSRLVEGARRSDELFIEAKGEPDVELYQSMAAIFRSVSRQYLERAAAISNRLQLVRRATRIQERSIRGSRAVSILISGSFISDAEQELILRLVADTNIAISSEIYKQLLKMRGEIKVAQKLIGNPAEK